MSGPEFDCTPWVAKADHDFLAIENNLAAERVPWDVVCFHAQQAAEKMFKAFMVGQGIVPARTHDLVGLLGRCARIDPELAPLEDDCLELSDYAVDPRYPFGPSEPGEREGRSAAEAARRIRSAILERLPGQ